MTRWAAIGGAVAVAAAVLCSASAHAQSGPKSDPKSEPKSDPKCAVPGYLLFGDSLLQRVTESVNKDKALRIVVLGGSSSTLPGANGASFAYPARLEAALKQRLPSVAISVTAIVKPRQTAAEATDSIDKLVLDQKPNLVIWQSGTYDAVHGTDVEEFRSAVAEGAEKLQGSGADVVLVNMQFSPRTESIVAVGAYADGLRWVAREREVPVFDRLAIMRHWYDGGQFDLYATTKDMSMAKQVHACLGDALAALIIDAARLQAREGAPVQ